MATLATVALKVAKALNRVNAAGTSIIDLETEIKEEIGATIEFYNKQPWHLTEWRGFELTTAASIIWYSTVDLTAGAGDQDGASRTAVNVRDILDIRYARESTDYDLRHIHYERFEDFQEATTSSGTPTYFTTYAGQIGVYPTPDTAYTLYFSGHVKPVTPTSDGDTSIWFDEAEEMIINGAARRVHMKYTKDFEEAAVHAGLEQEEASALQSQNIRASSTGKIRRRM